MRAKIFVTAFLLLAVSACDLGKRQKLDASIDTYLQALRHQDENVALLFVEPQNKDSFVQSYQDVKTFYISNAEVGTIFPKENSEDEVLATFKFEYFDPSGTSLMSANTMMTWKYHEELDNWLLQGDSPLGQVSRR